MNYLQKRFSVHLGQSDSFRDNYDRAFGKTGAPHTHTQVEPLPDPLQREDSAPTESEMVSVTITLSAFDADTLRHHQGVLPRWTEDAAVRHAIEAIQKALRK